MSDHALFSPSSAHRWVACPASTKHVSSEADDSSEYSRYGTFAHDIAAKLLLLGQDAETMWARSDGEFAVDHDMVEHLQGYLDLVRSFPKAQATFIERRVQVNDNVYGTADAIVKQPGLLHVIDLKYGAGTLVKAKDNPQLKLYSLGALHSLKGMDEYETVGLHVYQPRHPLGGHSVAYESVSDLRGEFTDRVERAIDNAQSENPKYRAGDHCKFCPALGHCKEAKKQHLALAQKAFAKRPEDLAQVDSTELARLLTLIPQVRRWADAVTQFCSDYMRKGNEIPGFKEVHTYPRRKWKDEEQAANALALLLGDSNIYELRSPAQIEKLLDKEQRKQLEELMYKKSGGTTVVSSDDKRPAINRKVFNPIDAPTAKELLG